MLVLTYLVIAMALVNEHHHHNILIQINMCHSSPNNMSYLYSLPRHYSPQHLSPRLDSPCWNIPKTTIYNYLRRMANMNQIYPIILPNPVRMRINISYSSPEIPTPMITLSHNQAIQLEHIQINLVPLCFSEIIVILPLVVWTIYIILYATSLLALTPWTFFKYIWLPSSYVRIYHSTASSWSTLRYRMQLHSSSQFSHALYVPEPISKLYALSYEFLSSYPHPISAELTYYNASSPNSLDNNSEFWLQHHSICVTMIYL